MQFAQVRLVRIIIELNLRNQENLLSDFWLPILQDCQTSETLLAGSSVGVLLVCLCLWLCWCLLLSGDPFHQIVHFGAILA